jgi:hypothetical protein
MHDEFEASVADSALYAQMAAPTPTPTPELTIPDVVEEDYLSELIDMSIPEVRPIPFSRMPDILSEVRSWLTRSVPGLNSYSFSFPPYFSRESSKYAVVSVNCPPVEANLELLKQKVRENSSGTTSSSPVFAKYVRPGIVALVYKHRGTWTKVYIVFTEVAGRMVGPLLGNNGFSYVAKAMMESVGLDLRPTGIYYKIMYKNELVKEVLLTNDTSYIDVLLGNGYSGKFFSQNAEHISNFFTRLLGYSTFSLNAMGLQGNFEAMEGVTLTPVQLQFQDWAQRNMTRGQYPEAVTAERKAQAFNDIQGMIPSGVGKLVDDFCKGKIVTTRLTEAAEILVGKGFADEVVAKGLESFKASLGSARNSRILSSNPVTLANRILQLPEFKLTA